MSCLRACVHLLVQGWLHRQLALFDSWGAVFRVDLFVELMGFMVRFVVRVALGLGVGSLCVVLPVAVWNFLIYDFGHVGWGSRRPSLLGRCFADA
jgi:hypothetical protein